MKKKSLLSIIIISFILSVVSAIVIINDSNKSKSREKDPVIPNNPPLVDPITIDLYTLTGTKYYLIEAGNNFSAAVNHKGQLYTWGLNNYGQLGHGNYENVNKPKLVNSLKDKNIARISLGTTQTFVVTKDGFLYSFGNNASNSLGLDSLNESFTTPVLNNFFTSLNIKISNVVSNNDTTLALTTDGRIYSWGNNDNYQLGHLNSSNIPQLVEFDYINETFIDVELQENIVVALTKSGDVYTWGKNINNTLGYYIDSDYQILPKKVEIENNKIIQIAAGIDHTVVLTNNDDLYVWGLNDFGQLGIGNFVNKVLPKKINMSKHNIVKIRGSKIKGSYFITKNLDIYYFGNNTQKIVKNFKDTKLEYPTQVVNTNLTSKYTKISIGNTHIYFSDLDGRNLANGNNDFGQLGLGHEEIVNEQTLLNELSWTLFESIIIEKGQYLTSYQFLEGNLELSNWYTEETLTFKLSPKVIFADDTVIYGRWLYN